MSRLHPLDIKSIVVVATVFFFPIWLGTIPAFDAWVGQDWARNVYNAGLVVWGFGLNAIFLHLRNRRRYPGSFKADA